MSKVRAQRSFNSSPSHFAKSPAVKVSRSKFNRSFSHKTTFNAGYLVPLYVDEVLPGDSFSVDTSSFARMATPIDAPMDDLKMDFYFFAVPNRLVWNNWEKFMGAQDDPGDSIDYLVPHMSSGAGYGELSIYDYFGIPTKIPNLEHSVLPFRAYNLIYNEWFRDENLQDSVIVNKGDTGDKVSDFVLLRKGKTRDYFTSCLPWPQKGSTAVTVPLLGSAPVDGLYISSDGSRATSLSAHRFPGFYGTDKSSFSGTMGQGIGFTGSGNPFDRDWETMSRQ